MSKKLIVHEYPAGAGKTYAICKHIENSNDMFLIAVPTKELQKEYTTKLTGALVINDDKNSVTRGNVGQYIAYNQKTINDTRILIITHTTLLTHADKFGKRELVIDELPSDLICTDHITTTQDDAVKFQQEIDLSTKDDLKGYIKSYAIDKVHRIAKIKLFKNKLSNDYFVYTTNAFTDKENRKHVNFHYLYLADGKIFDNYSTIHLLGANLSGSIAIKYFTELCGYSCEKGNLPVRGNPMSQRVRIIPLLKFNDDRDYISKTILEKYFDQMLSVVRDNSNQGVLIATNKVFESRINEDEINENDKHFKLISVKSHGLNSYSHVNQSAVLYSANPNPYDIPFMQKCSEVLGFESNELVDAYVFENVLDVVYQTVTRTAIRDPEYTGVLDFFIPDLRCVGFLTSKFSNCFIDWSLAIDVEVDKGGAQIGNTNKKGKGCAVTSTLVGLKVGRKKVSSMITKFTKDNGFAPNALEPSHIKKLVEASQLTRIPKDYSFKI